jgi:hypothetical protein
MTPLFKGFRETYVKEEISIQITNTQLINKAIQNGVSTSARITTVTHKSYKITEEA